MNLPAGTATLPDAAQAAPGDAVQASVVFDMLPEVPTRSVTVMVLDCCEKTFKAVAVHPDGTQVSAENGAAAVPLSVMLVFGLFTE